MPFDDLLDRNRIPPTWLQIRPHRLIVDDSSVFGGSVIMNGDFSTQQLRIIDSLGVTKYDYIGNNNTVAAPTLNIGNEAITNYDTQSSLRIDLVSSFNVDSSIFAAGGIRFQIPQDAANPFDPLLPLPDPSLGSSILNWYSSEANVALVSADTTDVFVRISKVGSQVQLDWESTLQTTNPASTLIVTGIPVIYRPINEVGITCVVFENSARKLGFGSVLPDGSFQLFWVNAGALDPTFTDAGDGAIYGLSISWNN